MKLAYLMNAYPMTSTTFIRREIAALEELGQPVLRYAVRHWDGPLVDPADREEQARTDYLLTGNAAGLLADGLRMLVTRPGAFLRGAAQALRVRRAARGGFVRHAAYLLEAIAFARRARAAGIDHVHVHFATNAATVAMLARTMGGPGWSFTVHGPDEFTDAPNLSLDDKVASARATVAISHHCRSQILRWVGFAHAGRIRVIRCGVFLDDFPPAPPEEAPVLLCIGRLCPQKGQEMIPAAVAALGDDFPGLKALLVGDGESRPAVERAIRAHGVEDRVVLMGWKSGDEVRELLRGSRALLLPTFAEGLPVVLMEALALGRPAISTFIAGIPELLDDGCGWIVPAGDPDALAGAMRAALEADAETLAALGREGRARVASRHDQRVNAAALLALFREEAETR